MRDLPHLKAAFAGLGPQGWQNLVDGTEGQHAELVKRAWPIFIREYGVDEGEDAVTVPREAAAEYMQALHANRVPEWVQDMALLGEISRAAKGGE